MAVYPWEIALGPPPDGSQANAIRGGIRSVSRAGNRVRVQVGPVTAEVTAESLDSLGLTVGGDVVASFDVAATRLVPL